jgi:hypothetical protein
MKPAHEQFDRWIRGPFRDLNHELEELRRAARAGGAPGSDAEREGLRTALRQQGRDHVRAVMEESPLIAGFAARLELLGNVGMLISACTRHGLNEPKEGRSPLREESMLALQLGASLGVAPRLILAPYATHNRSRDGDYKSFTRYPTEKVFIQYNTQAIFEYDKVARALECICDLGISSPISLEFFQESELALRAVCELSGKLLREIEVDTFFFAIRPYYKTAWVGHHAYRGLNAGDFSGINQIDLLLGLCTTQDPFYLNLLIEKMDYVLPHEQDVLRRCMVKTPILDAFLEAAANSSHQRWFQAGARAFLRLCESYARAANAHQDELVRRFVDEPAAKLDAAQLADVTSSGPPLSRLLEMLENLRCLRAARDRPGIQSRHKALQHIRKLLRD